MEIQQELLLSLVIILLPCEKNQSKGCPYGFFYLPAFYREMVSVKFIV